MSFMLVFRQDVLTRLFGPSSRTDLFQEEILSRLVAAATLFFSSLGLLAGATAAQSSSAKPPSGTVIGGDLSLLDFHIKKYRVPATGMVGSFVWIRSSEDAVRQDVNLRVRSSNREVFTPRIISIRGVKPGKAARIPFRIQPGKKARGKATITVSNGELLARDTIQVTRPTPGAGNWRQP